MIQQNSYCRHTSANFLLCCIRSWFSIFPIDGVDERVRSKYNLHVRCEILVEVTGFFWFFSIIFFDFSSNGLKIPRGLNLLHCLVGLHLTWGASSGILVGVTGSLLSRFGRGFLFFSQQWGYVYTVQYARRFLLRYEAGTGLGTEYLVPSWRSNQ